MKADNELILKYLSGILEGKEKLDFEEKLKSSPGLQSELENVKTKLAGMKELYISEVDERYFSGLIPRMRESIDIKRKPVPGRKFAYVLPVVIIIFVMTLSLPWGNGSKTNFDFSEMINQVVSTSDSTSLSYNVFDSFDQSSWSSTENENPFEVVIPEHWDIQADNYSGVVETPVIDEISGLDKLSSDKLDQLYKNLASLK